MVQVNLRALPRASLDHLRERLGVADSRLAISILEPLQVLSLRHLPGGASIIVDALESIGLTLPSGPGEFSGVDPASVPIVLWRSPSEYLLINTQPSRITPDLQSKFNFPEGLSQALDISDGCIVFEARGSLLEGLMQRLVDASAIVLSSGQCARTRIGEIPVMVVRIAAQRAWFLIDRTSDHYFAEWITYARKAIQ